MTIFCTKKENKIMKKKLKRIGIITAMLVCIFTTTVSAKSMSRDYNLMDLNAWTDV